MLFVGLFALLIGLGLVVGLGKLERGHVKAYKLREKLYGQRIARALFGSLDAWDTEGNRQLERWQGLACGILMMSVGIALIVIHYLPG